ncbi:MAG: ABC transporter permease [Oscillospiraceae bacterium]
MYIIKNAWKSIIRNKGRNILMAVISLVIAISACISLSIREAAVKAKEQTLDNLTVSAQITFDRSSLMSKMNSQTESTAGESTDKSTNREKFDMSKLSAASLTLDDYMKYTDLLSKDDSYFYTMEISLDGTADFIPYGNEEEDTSDEENKNMPDMPGGDKAPQSNGNKAPQSSGDFSVTGYSSYDAMVSMFGSDGTYSIKDGEMFDESSDSYECIISDELAMYNDISVGDSITLVNPENTEESFAFKVKGIYTNSSSDSGNSRFSHSDPANNIFTNTAALDKLVTASEKLNGSDSDSKAIRNEIGFTYVLASADNYYTFEKAVNSLGIPENYVLTSADLSAYEESVTPLSTLETMTSWFFIIVLIIGAIILVVLNIFNLRERKYEVGVLTAIGMKKGKVAIQFICELFIITFSALIVGTAVGSVVSVPVANTLLEQQVEKTESANEEISENFGFKNPDSGEKSMSMKKGFNGSTASNVKYVDSVNSATDMTVILQLIIMGIVLTIISGLAAMISIMRYEPLEILSNRS